MPELCRGGRCGNNRWLEPNVLEIGERSRVLSRVEMDAMATANICGVCDLSDEGGKLSLKFAQYYPMPGGQCKFHIVYDDVSRLFWTPATLVTDSQDQVGYCQQARKRREFTGTGGNERRVQVLMYSADALNWFDAGFVALGAGEPAQRSPAAIAVHDDADMQAGRGGFSDFVGKITLHCKVSRRGCNSMGWSEFLVS